MRQVQQGNGIQRKIRATAPQQKAGGAPFDPATEIAHYDMYVQIEGGNPTVTPVQIVGASFDYVFDVDTMQPGKYRIWFITIGVSGEESGPSAFYEFEILPFEYPLLPPTNLQ